MPSKLEIFHFWSLDPPKFFGLCALRQTPRRIFPESGGKYPYVSCSHGRYTWAAGVPGFRVEKGHAPEYSHFITSNGGLFPNPWADLARIGVGTSVC
jgi:hypothetical protein